MLHDNDAQSIQIWQDANLDKVFHYEEYYARESHEVE